MPGKVNGKFPYLFAELIKRGWNDADLRKLAGENILRVLREAEAIARNLQKICPASTAIGAKEVPGKCQANILVLGETGKSK